VISKEAALGLADGLQAALRRVVSASAARAQSPRGGGHSPVPPPSVGVLADVASAAASPHDRSPSRQEQITTGDPGTVCEDPGGECRPAPSPAARQRIAPTMRRTSLSGRRRAGPQRPSKAGPDDLAARQLSDGFGSVSPRATGNSPARAVPSLVQRHGRDRLQSPAKGSGGPPRTHGVTSTGCPSVPVVLRAAAAPVPPVRTQGSSSHRELVCDHRAALEAL
jgi:hypothetical protein